MPLSVFYPPIVAAHPIPLIIPLGNEEHLPLTERGIGRSAAPFDGFFPPSFFDATLRRASLACVEDLLPPGPLPAVNPPPSVSFLCSGPGLKKLF